MKTELDDESDRIMVPFAPPKDDQVTNGAPRGTKPDEVVMSRICSVPAFSDVVASLKPTEPAANSNAIMYCLSGSYSR
jgi:hypothetical protein